MRNLFSSWSLWAVIAAAVVTAVPLLIHLRRGERLAILGLVGLMFVCLFGILDRVGQQAQSTQLHLDNTQLHDDLEHLRTVNARQRDDLERIFRGKGDTVSVDRYLARADAQARKDAIASAQRFAERLGETWENDLARNGEMDRLSQQKAKQLRADWLPTVRYISHALLSDGEKLREQGFAVNAIPPGADVAESTLVVISRMEQRNSLTLGAMTIDGQYPVRLLMELQPALVEAGGSVLEPLSISFYFSTSGGASAGFAVLDIYAHKVHMRSGNNELGDNWEVEVSDFDAAAQEKLQGSIDGSLAKMISGVLTSARAYRTPLVGTPGATD